ncbi:hypothetical protein TRFO_32668 [Tritrichomonas foetus]|uniref:DH domain-containing protein n=1 Tax=Tritrichomonas foetus TaxID=1144522 RepID=A0A1J4JND9_9EUKA|nr:hypothetical protein TRFO_32668 [Tritrichomonas foetus]|eukprot:OHT00641.1 hypothetical protein TRFO_32668 [Tritrichomonas foetus]
MEGSNFVVAVLPELEPKCIFYPINTGLDLQQFDLIHNYDKYNLYIVTPSWIEKIDHSENLFLSDDFMDSIPHYRLQFLSSKCPAYILRFSVVIIDRKLDLKQWNIGINEGSDITFLDILHIFNKTFFVDCIDLKFELTDVNLNEPIISQKEIIKRQKIMLTFSMTDKEFSNSRNRIEVLKEIRDSEERYVRDLNLMTKNFNESLFQQCNIPLDVYRRTFKTVKEIKPVHKKFLKSLKKIGSALETSIGPLFNTYLPFFKVAVPHVVNFSSVILEITELLKQNRAFEKAISQICLNVFDGNTVESLLVTPVQRIPRYPLLLRELLKFTADCHWDKPEIQLAFDRLTKLNQEIDQKTSEAKFSNDIAVLQKKFGHSYNVLSSGRRLISNITVQNDNLYLFNDILLVQQVSDEGKIKYVEFPLMTSRVSIHKAKYTFSAKKIIYSCLITDETQTFAEQFSLTKRNFLLKICTFDGSLRWTKQTFEGPPELKSAALVSICTDMYLFGGKKADGTASNDLWWFHDNVWELLFTNNAPEGRYDCSMSVYDVSLVVFGGVNHNHKIFNDLLIFDIPSSTWSIIQSDEGPTPRFAHAAAALGTQLWLYGGKGPNGYLNDLYCYDFLSNAWWKLPDTPNHPEPRAWASAFWILEGKADYKFAIFGGVFKSATYKNIWGFDYDKVDWYEIETVGDQPIARYSHVSAIFNNYLYVIGGRNIQDTGLDSYKLDLTKKPYCWTAIPSSDEPDSFENGCCCVIDEYGLALYRRSLYFIKLKQKYDEKNFIPPANEVEVYDPFDGTRLSHPIYNIKSNQVSTQVDCPKSTFELSRHFENSEINLIMKKVDGHIKWKKQAIIALEGATVDDSCLIKDDIIIQDQGYDQSMNKNFVTVERGYKLRKTDNSISMGAIYKNHFKANSILMTKAETINKNNRSSSPPNSKSQQKKQNKKSNDSSKDKQDQQKNPNGKDTLNLISTQSQGKSLPSSPIPQHKNENQTNISQKQLQLNNNPLNNSPSENMTNEGTVASNLAAIPRKLKENKCMSVLTFRKKNAKMEIANPDPEEIAILVAKAAENARLKKKLSIKQEAQPPKENSIPTENVTSVSSFPSSNNDLPTKPKLAPLNLTLPLSDIRSSTPHSPRSPRSPKSPSSPRGSPFITVATKPQNSTNSMKGTVKSMSTVNQIPTQALSDHQSLTTIKVSSPIRPIDNGVRPVQRPKGQGAPVPNKQVQSNTPITQNVNNAQQTETATQQTTAVTNKQVTIQTSASSSSNQSAKPAGANKTTPASTHSTQNVKNSSQVSSSAFINKPTIPATDNRPATTMANKQTTTLPTQTKPAPMAQNKPTPTPNSQPTSATSNYPASASSNSGNPAPPAKQATINKAPEQQMNKVHPQIQAGKPQGTAPPAVNKVTATNTTKPTPTTAPNQASNVPHQNVATKPANPQILPAQQTINASNSNTSQARPMQTNTNLKPSAPSATNSTTTTAIKKEQPAQPVSRPAVNPVNVNKLAQTNTAAPGNTIQPSTSAASIKSNHPPITSQSAKPTAVTTTAPVKQAQPQQVTNQVNANRPPSQNSATQARPTSSSTQAGNAVKQAPTTSTTSKPSPSPLNARPATSINTSKPVPQAKTIDQNYPSIPAPTTPSSTVVNPTKPQQTTAARPTSANPSNQKTTTSGVTNKPAENTTPQAAAPTNQTANTATKPPIQRQTPATTTTVNRPAPTKTTGTINPTTAAPKQRFTPVQNPATNPNPALVSVASSSAKPTPNANNQPDTKPATVTTITAQKPTNTSIAARPATAAATVKSNTGNPTTKPPAATNVVSKAPQHALPAKPQATTVQNPKLTTAANQPVSRDAPVQTQQRHLQTSATTAASVNKPAANQATQQVSRPPQTAHNKPAATNSSMIANHPTRPVTTAQPKPEPSAATSTVARPHQTTSIKPQQGAPSSAAKPVATANSTRPVTSTAFKPPHQAAPAKQTVPAANRAIPAKKPT